MQRLLELARRWREPSWPERQEVVAQILATSDFLTEEAAAFALNQQMHVLTEPALRRFVERLPLPSDRRVLLWHTDRAPLAGWQEALLLWLSEHRGTLVLAEPAATLVKALLKRLAVETVQLETELHLKACLEEADALMAVGDEVVHQEVQAAMAQVRRPPERVRLLPARYGVAVLDGQETPDELEGLAVDALLFEGFGIRSVRLLWAPESLQPDRLLEALAHFRGVFPAHPATPGRLKMPWAWLKAAGIPHAYGEGLEFLLSKGAPEVQTPGHLRWVPYRSLAEVPAWLRTHASEISTVVARSELLQQLPPLPGRTAPGQAHRPPFPDPVGTAIGALYELLS